MSLWGKLLAGGLGVAAVGGLAGCEEDNEFAYFKVRATLSQNADAAFLSRIASCGVNVVSGTDGRLLDFAPISCPDGQVRSPELGLIDWSTAETSGKVRFVVIVRDRVREIARGTSADFDIRPNATTEGTMTVDRLPDPPMP
jgi:hypothetical protein